MRQYQPIWEAIKKRKKITIVVHNAQYRRIIQAVRKEKWKDAGFRYLSSEKNIHFKLFESIDPNKKTVTFFLKTYRTAYNLEDI